jgi:hypothetical protein
MCPPNAHTPQDQTHSTPADAGAGAWAAAPDGCRAFYDAARHCLAPGTDAVVETPEVLAALLAAALAQARLLTRGSLVRVWRVLRNELTVYEALSGGDPDAPLAHRAE